MPNNCYRRLLTEYRLINTSIPAPCVEKHRGLGSIINNVLIPALIASNQLPHYGHCEWSYDCYYGDLFPTWPKYDYVGDPRAGCLDALTKYAPCQAEDVLSAAATALLDSHRRVPPAGVYTAVHIRGGDKVRGESRPFAHMTANVNWWVNFIRNHSRGSNLFICSDDCTIATNVSRAFSNVSISCDRQGGRRGTEVYGCNKTRAFLRDLWRMADADVFLGSWKSNVARLVTKLRRYETTVPVPGTKMIPF